MAPVFSKEAILQGSIDHLCLVCESYLRTEREVFQHVSTPGHQQSLDSTGYVEKYKNDRIRKVKKWYFCEFCNILVTTIPKVRLHVEDQQHKQNIASQMITRVDDIIVSGDIEIQEEAWHGFIDENTCTICNLEFEDMNKHKMESTHIINLIQSKISNDFNNSYRKIDDSTFHCLTCNMVVVEITAHIDDIKHKILLRKSIKERSLKSREENKNEIFNENCLPQAITENDVVNYKKNLPNENAIANTSNEVSNVWGNNICVKNKGDINSNCMINVSDINDAKNSQRFIICDIDGKTSCILCNCDVEPLELMIHLESLHHLNMLKMSKEQNNNDHIPVILDSTPKFQKENIDINFESRTAVCRKCSDILEFDPKIIEKHIGEHKNKVQKEATATVPKLFKKDEKIKVESNGALFTSPVTLKNVHRKNIETNVTETKNPKGDDDVIQKLIKEHDLTYIATGNKVYCQKCNKPIQSSVKNINEHVHGESHRIKIRSSDKPTHSKDNESKKLGTKNCNLPRVPFKLYVKTLSTIKNIFGEDVILNEKYCINLLAFTFFTIINPGQLKCLVCQINVSIQNIKQHLGTEKHERAMEEVPVVIYTDSEFIREIRSGLFQCGFCNVVVSWEGMENHLKSTIHKESKTFANWRLSQHLPQIQQHSTEREIHNNFLIHLMFSRM